MIARCSDFGHHRYRFHGQITWFKSLDEIIAGVILTCISTIMLEIEHKGDNRTTYFLLTSPIFVSALCLRSHKSDVGGSNDFQKALALKGMSNKSSISLSYLTSRESGKTRTYDDFKFRLGSGGFRNPDLRDLIFYQFGALARDSNHSM